MKVDAINGLNCKVNCAFGEKQKKHENLSVTNSLRVPNLARVPVIVLLAMNPATLNSAVSTISETDSPNHIVMVKKPEQSLNIGKMTSVAELPQAPQKTDPPFGWAEFNDFGNHIKFSMPAKGNGADYHLVFTAAKDENSKIEDIYLVKNDGKKYLCSDVHPPTVTKFIYHNLGKDKEFCSVETIESLVGPDGHEKGVMSRQIRLDDESAQKIIDLLSGDTKWKNNTYIVFKEVFDDKLEEPHAALYQQIK